MIRFRFGGSIQQSLSSKGSTPTDQRIVAANRYASKRRFGFWLKHVPDMQGIPPRPAVGNRYPASSGIHGKSLSVSRLPSKIPRLHNLLEHDLEQSFKMRCSRPHAAERQSAAVEVGSLSTARPHESAFVDGSGILSSRPCNSRRVGISSNPCPCSGLADIHLCQGPEPQRNGFYNPSGPLGKRFQQDTHSSLAWPCWTVRAGTGVIELLEPFRQPYHLAPAAPPNRSALRHTPERALARSAVTLPWHARE